MPTREDGAQGPEQARLRTQSSRYLEIERIEFRCKENSEQQNDGDIVSKGSRPFPLERGPVMRGELADNTPSLGANSPGLPESSPSIMLERHQGNFVLQVSS